MKPSITTSAFYALVGDPDTADVILGDLTELRAERAAQHGLRAARRWYWRELCRSVPTLLLRRLREAPARVILSALLGVLTIWAVQIPFILASNGLSPAAYYVAVFIAGRLVGGIAAGVLVAGINRAAPLAAAAWVIPCWILWTLVGTILTAVMGAVVPGSAPASVEINLFAAVPDLLAIAGVIIGALLTVERSRARPASR